MKTIKSRKVLTMIVALAMIVTMFSCLAMTSAATDDPLMTSADGMFTQTVTIGWFDEVMFTAIPAYDAGGYWLGTSFDTEEDALAVNWSLSDNTGFYIFDQGAMEWGDGYAAYIHITVGFYYDEFWDAVIASDPNVGPTVVSAVNPGTYGSVDFNIVVNEDIYGDVEITEAEDVIFQVVDPLTNLINSGSGTVLSSDFYSSFDVRSFPTVMDSAVRMMYASSGAVIGGYTTSAYGDYVAAMRVNSTWHTEFYVPETNEFFGWQYRVYRDTNSDGIFELVPLSANIGADSFLLLDNDLVQWRFGEMEEVNNAFPMTITLLIT